MINIKKLFLISGISGAGKTSIMRKLMDNEVISFTTREKRIGEVDGKDYVFISEREYFDLYTDNQLAEWATYGGNYYGITKHELERKLKNNHAFCIVNLHGKEQLGKLYPNYTSIFIYTDRENAITQMSLRGDRQENIDNRISTYEEEMKNVIHYNYVIKNTYGKFDEVVEIIRQIIKVEEELIYEKN